MIKIVDQNDRHYGHHKHGVQLRWSWIINVPGGYVEVQWGYGDALRGYTESSDLELLRQRKAKQRQKDNFVIRIPIWPTWGSFINCVQYFHQHCGAPSIYPPRWSLYRPSAICDDHLCTRGLLPIQSFSSIQAVCYKQNASITQNCKSCKDYYVVKAGAKDILDLHKYTYYSGMSITQAKGEVWSILRNWIFV